MNLLADQVVSSYQDRAALARAESRPVTPHLLARALDGATHVTEFPCGPGHFLPAYAQAGVRARLLDANRHMLTVATRHACDTGVTELTVGCHFLHQLPALHGEDLVVVPNAALNQLAAQMPLPRVLAYLRRAVRPGARLLLQYLASDDTGPGCPFYSPTLPNGHQAQDHRFLTPDGQEVIRHRRQHHTSDDAQVRIEFTYTVPGRISHTARVHLALPTTAAVEATLTGTGWATAHAHTLSGLREILATAGSRR